MTKLSLLPSLDATVAHRDPGHGQDRGHGQHDHHDHHHHHAHDDEPAAEGHHTPPRFWRSLDHLRGNDQTKLWMENEFPHGLAPAEFGDVTRDGQEAKPGFVRREVLKLMGASMAIAGVGCDFVRRPEDLILPYVKQPEEIIPGVPNFYATVFPSPHGAVGMLVESHEGRPTKIEGNPDHPTSGGRTDRFHQAEVYELYDPERSRTPMQKGAASTWEAFDGALKDALSQTPGGNGLALLLDRAGGVTEQRLLAQVKAKYPAAQIYRYDPLAADNLLAGAELVFGTGTRVHHRAERADVLVAVDNDFITEGPESLTLSRGFAEGRNWDVVRSSGQASVMNRLYVVEAAFSSTGASGDNRLRVARGEMGEFLKALAGELLGRHALMLPESFGGAAATAQLKAGIKTSWKAGNEKFVPALAKDLASKRGKALVLVGNAQPAAVVALGHLINAALGAFDGAEPAAEVSAPFPPSKAKADAFFAGGEPGDGPAHWSLARPTAHVGSAASLKALVDQLNGGKVKTLIVVGPNPVFSAPRSLKVAEAFGKASSVIHAGLRMDQTAKVAAWHVPLAHWLEAWGDGVAWDGTTSVQQPLIRPLHGARSNLELLAAVAGEGAKGHELVKSTWMDDLGSVADDKAWRKALHAGVLPEPARRTAPVGGADDGADAYTQYIAGRFAEATAGAAGRVATGLGAVKAASPSKDQLDVVIKYDFKLADGRYAHNGWLQELPDSMTKLCWDTALLMGPALANELGINSRVYKNSYQAEEVRLTVGDQTVAVPVFVQPGVAPYSVVVALGYGQSDVGYIANGVGVDLWPVVPADGSLGAVGKIEKTGRMIELAGTQEHFAIETATRGATFQNLKRLNETFEEDRPYLMVGTVDEYKQNPAFAQKGQLRVASDGKLVDPPGVRSVTRAGGEQAAPTRPDRPIQPFYDVFAYEGQQWGMVIDLTTCTSCHACVTACQAENNIPIVGRAQVLFGRELHWIRIDRYYEGDVDAPNAIHQPINCLHCENAPCEPVCPVAATVHDTEGINGMVYNRCIGTRYCANNCPAKVRRFNYFDFSKTAHLALSDEEKRRSQTLEMQRNPDVTVRFRGVIEKCSYCVQRIQEAKFKAKREGRDSKNLPDGSITPACGQACPTGAITFGNINDPKSRVAKMKQTDRNFETFSELNIRPRTTYLARLTNPNPEIG